MTIQGIGGGSFLPPPATGIGGRPSAPVTPPTGGAEPDAAAVHTTAPVAAPDGVDPALWSVLTHEEQAFFASQAQLGPLSYGPARPVFGGEAPLGQRIDVRA